MRSASITPTPQVVTIDSLNQALYHSSINDVQERSDSSSECFTEELHSMELNFLSTLDNLFISHNGKKEFCNCPWRSVLDIKRPNGRVVLEAVKKVAFLKCHKENIEVFNTSTNQLIILIEFLGGGCMSMLSRVQVYDPFGHPIGFVEKPPSQCFSWTPDSYEILSKTEETIYIVNSSSKILTLSRFQVSTKDGNQVVAEIISKGYGWSLNYKENLTPNNRALIIGFALFLESVESSKKGAII